MEVVALVIGLVAAGTVLPALIILCGMKRKDAPVGASMANRRGAPGGAQLQIDPILQPNWAAKNAAREAAEKKQLAIIMSSKQARLHRVGGGAGGDEPPVTVLMRQPSTMADKFALPSHLTKQLGQPSRRGLGSGGTAARSGTPLQDGSVEGIPLPPPQLSSEHKLLPPPLARPELAYIASPFTTNSISASVSRSAVNDSSINFRTSAGSEIPPELLPRAFNSSTSTASRRGAPAALGSPMAGGLPESSSVMAPVTEMFPLQDSSIAGGGEGGATDPRVATSGPFVRGSNSGAGIAWPPTGLDENGANGTVRGSSFQGQQPQPAGPGANQDGPRGSQGCPHPRVAALSPQLAPSGRATSGDSFSRSVLRALSGTQGQQQPQQSQQQQQQLGEKDGGGEGAQVQDGQRPSSDFVEQLTQGVDWSAAPVSGEAARRSSYALGTGSGRDAAQELLSTSGRLQTSAPATSENGGRRASGAAPTAAAGSGGSVSYRALAGFGAASRSAAGRTISSRDLNGGPVMRLPSPLGGRSSTSLLDPQAAPGSASGGSGGRSAVGSALSKRWTANGDLTPPLTLASVASAAPPDLEAQLPGSADRAAVIGPETTTQGSPSAAIMTSRSQRSIILLREGGGGGSGGGSGSGGLLEDASNSHRALGLGTSFRGERPSSAAAAAAAAVAASIAAATAARGSGSGGAPSLAAVGRTTLTWSGMAAAPLVDVAAGPGARTSAGEGEGGPLGAAPPGSRAARAQALLARNRTNLSRLAAAATAGGSGGVAVDVQP